MLAVNQHTIVVLLGLGFCLDQVVFGGLHLYAVSLGFVLC